MPKGKSRYSKATLDALTAKGRQILRDDSFEITPKKVREFEKKVFKEPERSPTVPLVFENVDVDPAIIARYGWSKIMTLVNRYASGEYAWFKPWLDGYDYHDIWGVGIKSIPRMVHRQKGMPTLWFLMPHAELYARGDIRGRTIYIRRPDVLAREARSR
jgi:hypothetical protein